MSEHSLHFSKRTSIGLSLGFLFIVLLAVLTWYVATAPVREEVDTAAATALRDSEDTPYTTLDGSPFLFNEFRGQVRVVQVWASWSPSSAEDLRALNQLAETIASDDVVFIAINRMEPKRRIEAYLAQLPTLQALTVVVDETDAYYKASEGYAMPETRIYDRTGNVHTEIRGPIAIEDIEPVIRELIE